MIPPDSPGCGWTAAAPTGICQCGRPPLYSRLGRNGRPDRMTDRDATAMCSTKCNICGLNWRRNASKYLVAQFVSTPFNSPPAGGSRHHSDVSSDLCQTVCPGGGRKVRISTTTTATQTTIETEEVEHHRHRNSQLVCAIETYNAYATGKMVDRKSYTASSLL